jgi:hypothetical protein
LQSKGACSPLIVHVVGESATSLSCARRLARGVSGGGADVGLSTHQSSKQAVQCLVECEHSSMHSLINRTTHATHCHTARPCHTCGCMRGQHHAASTDSAGPTACVTQVRREPKARRRPRRYAPWWARWRFGLWSPRQPQSATTCGYRTHGRHVGCACDNQ